MKDKLIYSMSIFTSIIPRKAYISELVGVENHQLVHLFIFDISKFNMTKYLLFLLVATCAYQTIGKNIPNSKK